MLYGCYCCVLSLQWRHNEHDGVSNHQPAIVYSAVYSGAVQRKHQSSASLAFVRGNHRSPVNSPHKGLVTRKMFDDVIMCPLDPCILTDLLGQIQKYYDMANKYTRMGLVDSSNISLLAGPILHWHQDDSTLGHRPYLHCCAQYCTCTFLFSCNEIFST